MECPQTQMVDIYDFWRYDTASDLIPTTFSHFADAFIQSDLQATLQPMRVSRHH